MRPDATEKLATAGRSGGASPSFLSRRSWKVDEDQGTAAKKGRCVHILQSRNASERG